MHKMKLAFIGCGDIANYTAWFARLNRGIEMTACCDISLERADKFAHKFGIKQVFSDFSEMLVRTELDAVYLAIPHNLHFPLIIQALDAGKHILTEKPITRTLAEGVEIVRLAERAGMKLAVNYQYRYDSACYRLANASQSGQLGEIRYGRINIPWQRNRDYFEKSAWHQTLAQAGGGTLLTQGSHFLDIALWACHSPVVSVNAATSRRVFRQVEVEDLAMAILELENGALLEICSSMIAATEQPATIELYGSQATARYTGTFIPTLKFTGRNIKTKRLHIPGVHALQRSLEGFRHWVMLDEPYLTPGSATLDVLAAVEAIYQSAYSGKTIKVART